MTRSRALAAGTRIAHLPAGMWDPYDQLAKCLLSRALEHLGSAHPEHEVHASAQRIDLWFEPRPVADDERTPYGLLGRISAEACLLEHFSTTPDLLAVRACVRKLHNLDHWRAREAKRTQRPRPPLPRLWILSPGRPRTAIARYQMQPMHDWPKGFLHTTDGLSLHVVVLRELPVTRDSLLLRLLGAGATLARAIEELHALPEQAWERTMATPLLLAFRFKSPSTLLQPPADEVFMHPYTEKLLADYAEWEQRTFAKGREQGLERGLEQLRRTLEAVYRARFDIMPAELQEALARVRDGGALERLGAVFAACSQHDIAAAVHAAATAG